MILVQGQWHRDVFSSFFFFFVHLSPCFFFLLFLFFIFYFFYALSPPLASITCVSNLTSDKRFKGKKEKGKERIVVSPCR